MIRSIRILSLLLLTALVGHNLRAQVPTGTPPFGSYGGGPDVINLANLNVHWSIPVLHKPGRGTDFTYDLGYDSSVWYPVYSGSSQVWQPVALWGWTGQTEIATGYITYTTTQQPTCYTNGTYYGIKYDYTNWTYYDTFGTAHNFGGDVYYIQPTGYFCQSSSGGGFTTTAGDGSGWTLSVSNSAIVQSLTSANGQAVTAPVNSSTGAGTYIDRNGNKITVDSSGHFYDTLSATTATLTVTGTGTPASPMTFTYTAPNGSASYKMVYSTYKVQTHFGCSNITEYGGANGTSTYLVSEVDLPDGSKYSFGYESTLGGASGAVTGRLASVTLPSGGTISYTYLGGDSSHNGITCTDGSAAGLKRYTPDTGSSAYWNYARTPGTGMAYTTTITDPTSSANQTVIQFQGIYETERQVYQGSASGTPLTTTNTCYNGAASPCTSRAIVLPITQRNVSSQFGSSGLQSLQTLKYNNYGLLTEEDDYDYASGAPTTVLKRTYIVYASLSNSIYDMPATVTICTGTGTASSCNGVGTVVAQTTYTYDQGSVSTSGAPQHVTVSGSRGNATTISSLVSGSTTLNKTFTYYDTGMVKTATDVNNGVTIFSYSSSSCGYAFPTGVTEAISNLTRSYAWNCTGGVETSVTDENSKSTTTTYNDAHFWRPASVTDPTNAVTNYTYPTSSPYNWVESYMNFNGTSSTVDVRTTVDGLGRVHLQQTKQGPSSSSYDTVETDYDIVGRPAKVSLPFSAAAGSTNSSAPGTSTLYDVFNRPTSVTDSGGGSTSYNYTQNDTEVTLGPPPTGENSKQRQLEYDGLGRLSSVCEITTASGYGTCGQQTTQNGYWTKYTYDPLGDLISVIQNAQASSSYRQSRSYTYDGLSRLTSESNPESGTTTYAFDTDSTCGTSTGDLVKKVDAVGNVICKVYDALHRLTAITYPSGSYAPVTPAKHFVYDSATVNGATMSNPEGRLAEAYTCTSSCSSKITDEGFSYSVRGDLTDTYQSTQHSGGYYHLTAAYFANGVVNQFSGLPGLTTMTYNVEGEGRPSTVSAGSGQNPVTSTSYNVFGQPYQVNFGSQDSDAFGYDSNTGRMTQYQFNINGQADSGTLTWNAISTLQKLVINDAFNSADSQTCNFTHDDLVRIASANCGSGWSQTFGYDAFGNITKSGNNQFLPVYTNPVTGQNTNRFVSIPGTTGSYDANGNVLSDGSHTYAWDADGNSITLDAVNLTFDAFDRMVEQNRSGTYTQIAYSPTGAKLALMSGQTLQKAFISLPGGATAIYTASGLDHYRHPDWLGSARLTSSPSRTVLSTVAYAPFGDSYAPSGTADSSFTGQDQDTVTGDYDFPAREYNATQGRWPLPDPAGLAAVDIANPQSWNRYAYALNNPLSIVDPTGLCGVDDAVYDASCGPGDANYFGGGGQGGQGVPGGSGGLGPPSVFDLIDCLIMAGQGLADIESCYLSISGNTFQVHGDGGGGGGGILSRLINAAKSAVSSVCSAVPDASTISGGFDAGYGMTGGLSGGIIANGRSGELSWQLTGTFSYGYISNDAYVSLGFVKKAPSNGSTSGPSKTSAYGIWRTGIVAGSNSVQGTYGPSDFPITFARQTNYTVNTATIPYAGYAIYPARSLCKLITGN